MSFYKNLNNFQACKFLKIYLNNEYLFAVVLNRGNSGKFTRSDCSTQKEKCIDQFNNKIRLTLIFTFVYYGT